MENKKYKVSLEKINEKDCLKFIMEKEEFIIDLNSDEQSKLREFFYKTLEILFCEKIEFELVIVDGYNELLFIDIAKDYIKKLNEEISNIYNSIPEELKQSLQNEEELVLAK